MYLPPRNPYNVECLAPYKGPIIPAIAVGGFLEDDKLSYEGKDYVNSTGLVLTFLVNSPRDGETLEPALEWERRCVVRTADYTAQLHTATEQSTRCRFIDFMEGWQRPEFMDVAYSSERSIEDELERTSRAEAKTVIVSYALMFVYVSLALGEYKSAGQFFVSLSTHPPFPLAFSFNE